MQLLTVLNKFSPVLVVIPIFIWVKSIKLWKTMYEEHKALELFYKKHHCVVQYAMGQGMTGWPAYEGRLVNGPLTWNKFYEPIIYFIDTSERTLDIAVMNITMKPVIDAIERALIKGVRVRIISDFQHMKNDVFVKALQSKGAEVLFYMHYDINTYMHYKFAVKDYCPETGCGFTISGSMNWTTSSTVENYEDLVFSINKDMIRDLQENFQITWDYLLTKNKQFKAKAAQKRV